MTPPDGLDGHVGAEPVGQAHDHLGGSSLCPGLTMSAPNQDTAFSSRESAMSMATTRLGPYSQAVAARASPTGPAPTTATLAGAVAVEHADLEPGEQDVGQEQHLLVAEPLGDLVEAVVGERDAGQLGLGAVDQVAEDPAAAALALPVHPLAAVEAAPAGPDTGRPGRGRPGGRSRPASPVSTTVPTASWPRVRLLAGGHVALEDVQVGAADGGGVDLDDRVAGV